MNLHAKLLEREAAGRPVTVGLIGAGKFGTMFLAQARLTRGMHVVGVADLDVARARSQLKTAGWPDEVYAAGSLADAHKKRTTLVTESADALIADPADRGHRGGDRRAGRRHTITRYGDRQRQAHRDGERRSRCGGGPAAGAPRQGRGRRLFARLGRSAGADLRTRRLGARRRVQGDLRRQGHALRAALSQVQSRQCLGHPRQISEHLRPQVDQPEDVQFIRRWHQVRHRDDGRLQCDRAGAAERRA